MSEAIVDNFVTVVSVGARESQENNENINFDSISSGYVTVLTIGDDQNKKNIKDVTEEVIVYRLPGERLGFGLKFEGGTKASEFVKRLFIQSCAADSPASRVKSSWGKLTEGDEVLEIDSVPVNTMTRIDCVRCLKDSNVAIKLLIRHTYHYETRTKAEVPPLIISAEEKRVAPPPPPVPPRKISRKLLKNLNATLNKESSDTVDAKSQDTVKQRVMQSPRGSIRSYNSPDVSRRDRRFSDGSLGPPDAEVYVDLFLQESTQSLSESDDTGSTISTVIDRFGSFPTTTTSSFSGSLPSTPTSIQRQLDISNINIYEDEDIILHKGFGKSVSLTREENNNIILDEISPLCFLDAPLSYGNESTKIIVPDEIDHIQEEQNVIDDTKLIMKKPPVPPRSKDLHSNTEKSSEEQKNNIENLPRLVDFVPKSVNGIKETENTTEVMKMFLENERYKTDFDYYDRENDNYTNGVDLYSSKWSLSSQLATIGEVEEEGISDFNFIRTAVKSTPVVIVENTDTNEEKIKNGIAEKENIDKDPNGIMATLSSDSRQPPDGHEFPDFIENHNVSTNYYREKDIHTNSINTDLLQQSTNHTLEEFPKQNNLLICQSVSTSNTDLRPKMYESTEDLKFDFVPEPNLLHTRSQSLIDVSALTKQKNTKWNQMFEQRRKGLSKLKGLVIPEAVENEVSSSVNIPEIKSQTAATIYLPVPKLDNSFQNTEGHSSSHKDLLKPSLVIPTNSISNLPKYSPAFKRKSLQVYPTSINKSDNSDYVNNIEFPKYCDKSSPKGNKVNDDDLNPPKSLESISSPTRSDCSFDYISSSKKYNKSNNDAFQKFPTSKVEDESDNDSAVSSSQSSYNSRYSPPSSPTRSYELNHYSKKQDEDDKSAQNRLLKPTSVEAINRKNILASAKCRSGKDLKIGSPVIRRKQEEDQLNKIATEIHQNGNIKEDEVESKELESIDNPPPVTLPVEDVTTPDNNEENDNEEIKADELETTETLATPQNSVENSVSADPNKMATKNIFFNLKPTPPRLSTLSKKLENLPDKLSRDSIDNWKSKKSSPMNVKALKQCFESLTLPLPAKPKVTLLKTPMPKTNLFNNAIEESKTLITNGINKEKLEKVESLVPITEKRKLFNKTFDSETKTVVLKTDSVISLGIILSGGAEENKDIFIHRIRYASVAYNDGRLKKGDKIVSINGKSTKGLTYSEATELLKQPVHEFRIIIEDIQNIVVPSPVSSRTGSLYRKFTKDIVPNTTETRVANHTITIIKNGAGLGFSIEGGLDSPQGDVPLTIQKIFTGGPADKSGKLKVGDEIIKINEIHFTKFTRVEAWNAMKKIPDGNVYLHIYR